VKLSILEQRALAEPVDNNKRAAVRHGSFAFTLLEVMIASGILFICLFAILGLLANTLRNARSLQRIPVDAGMLAAELSLTNKLSEGVDSGDFEEPYRDFHWRQEIFQAETNGLFAVDFVVYKRGNEHSPESHMTVLFFRPESPLTPGRLR
jgi:type II secretory pathway component PulJ